MQGDDHDQDHAGDDHDDDDYDDDGNDEDDFAIAYKDDHNNDENDDDHINIVGTGLFFPLYCCPTGSTVAGPDHDDDHENN